VLFGPITKTNLIALQKKIIASLARGNKNFNYMLAASACAQAIKLQHALELLETQTLLSFNKYLKNLFDQASKEKSKGVKRLVAKSEFNFIFMKSNELLAKNFEHPKTKVLFDIVEQEITDAKRKIIVFTQFRETATMLCKNLNSIKNFQAKIFVGQAKRAGSGLSQKEQKAILKEFGDGEINCLVATSIGEEGLDIPEVNAVIFYEPVPSAIRAIQRAGRTARLIKGKLIILVTKGTRDEAFYYVARAKEKRMHKAINQIKQTLTSKLKTEKQKRL
jgi:Fanconi anemia group M protein